MRLNNVVFICTCLLLFTGCNMPSVALLVSTSQALPTETDAMIAPPVTEYTPITMPTAAIVEPALLTETPMLNPGECLVLLVPSEGVVYPQDKEIKFTWEAMPGAGKYLLEVANSTGWLLSIETLVPSYEVTAEMFPGAMIYSWTVLVLDTSGKQICRAGPWSFSISARKSYPTEKPDKDEGGGREGPDEGGDWGGGDDDFPFPDW